MNWSIKVQLYEGALLHSENVYTFEDKSTANAGVLDACDLLEETDGVTEINGDKRV